MQVTFDLPDEVITQLQPFEDKLPQILELRLRELNAISTSGFSGILFAKNVVNASFVRLTENSPVSTFVGRRPFAAVQTTLFVTKRVGSLFCRKKCSLDGGKRSAPNKCTDG